MNAVATALKLHFGATSGGGHIFASRAMFTDETYKEKKQDFCNALVGACKRSILVHIPIDSITMGSKDSLTEFLNAVQSSEISCIDHENDPNALSAPNAYPQLSLALVNLPAGLKMIAQLSFCPGVFEGTMIDRVSVADYRDFRQWSPESLWPIELVGTAGDYSVNIMGLKKNFSVKVPEQHMGALNSLVAEQTRWIGTPEVASKKINPNGYKISGISGSST